MPTQTEIANALGISQPRVSHLVAKGMPTASVEDALSWHQGRIRPPPNHSPDPPERKASVRTLPEEQAALAASRRRLIELQIAEKEGRLVDRAQADRTFYGAFKIFAAMVTAMVNTLGPRLYGVTDERQIDATIADEIRHTLTAIATQKERVCPNEPK